MALKTQGVYLSRAGVEVAEITGFSGPTKTSPEIDVTHLRSTAKEFLTGLADPGEITFTGWLNTTDAAQLAIRADQDSQSVSAYTLTLTDTPPTVISFNASVREFTPSGQPDGAIALALALRITGLPVWS